MGKVTRKRYGADFKAKVALEAIKGELTLAGLSAKYGIHQTMIAAWKRQALEGLASTFSGKAEAAVATGEAELTRLHDYRGLGSKRTESLCKPDWTSNCRAVAQLLQTV